MLNVLMIGMMDIPGGIEQMVYQIFQRLDPGKIHCDFLCYCRRCVYEDELKAAGSRVYHVTRRGENPLRCRRELKSFFKEKGDAYDYIWIHTSSASNCMGHIFARRYTHAQIITHSHGTHFESRKGLVHMLHTFLHKRHQRTLTRCTDFYFACSRAAGEWLYGTRAHPVEIVKNGIVPERYRFDPAVRSRIRASLSLDGCSVIGHAGRFSTVKNHTFLIDIFSVLAGESDTYRLLLAGEGELLPEIRQKVSDLGLEEKVLFIGFREDLNCILQAVDVLLLPSLYEGFPLVAVEAQASGAACLLSDTISREVSLTDLATYMSLNEPPEKWADKIRELLLRHRETDRTVYGRKIREAGYDIAHTASELERFLLQHKG